MSKSTIVKYAWESKIMDITIKYGEEKFSFNLNSEIIIDENRINHEIQEQPSAYAFIAMLHKKLLRITSDKKKQVEKTYASMYMSYKGKNDPSTNRPMVNDLVNETIIASKRYQTALEEYGDALHNSDILEVCVRSFEQRQALIQTLSANIRKSN